MRRYIMITHKKPRINRQDRQKITFSGSAYPKEISQQYTLGIKTVVRSSRGSTALADVCGV